MTYGLIQFSIYEYNGILSWCNDSNTKNIVINDSMQTNIQKISSHFRIYMRFDHQAIRVASRQRAIKHDLALLCRWDEDRGHHAYYNARHRPSNCRRSSRQTAGTAQGQRSSKMGEAALIIPPVSAESDTASPLPSK